MAGLRTAEWRKLRVEILRRDQNTCYLCGTPEANEVDHIRPRSKGGAEYDPENLAAICKRCNLLKGDKIGHKGVFLAQQTTPPLLVKVDLPENDPISSDFNVVLNPDILGHAETDRPNVYRSGDRLIGSPTPRIRAAAVEGDYEKAELALEFAKSIGINLMPWQITALRELLQTTNGKWTRRTLGIVCSRQVGKTELAKIRILAGIYLFEEKSIILMSVNAQQAEMTLYQINDIITSNPSLMHLYQRYYLTNGKQEIRFKNGARIIVVAATNNGSRGLSADFVFLDELRTITPEAMEAVSFTMNARPAAQMLTVSNAGDKSSTVLNNLRDKAIADVSPTLGWLEWSAHPSRKIEDPKGWVEAVPALGHTMTEEILRHSLATSDPLTFRVEVLCQFVDNLASPFEIGAWDKCKDESIVVEPGGLTYFAFDKSYTNKYAVLIAGQKVDEMRVKVKVLQVWNTATPLDDRQVASDINAHIMRFRPKVLMYDKWVSENVASYLKGSGTTLMDVSGKMQNEASNRLAQLMSHGQLLHPNDLVLNEAIAACATKHTEYGWKIVRRKSAGEICAAIGVAMVAWYASRPQAVAQIIVN
jgi:hypothetical protein